MQHKAESQLALPQHDLKIPAVLMRGGTSRGLVFNRDDLPGNFSDDRRLWDLIFLCALGSPDSRQLDGVGAGDSHTSKVVVVNPSLTPGIDVDFLFAEVAIEQARVDYAGNSGNIISAIGLYALEEGWVKPKTPKTLVRIHNLNTDKVIEVLVPVEDEQAVSSGTFSIDGVPGYGAEIEMRFPNPAATLSPALLPTAEPITTLSIMGTGKIDVTLLDAANPIVLIDGAALEVDPQTPIATLNHNAELLERIQAIRGHAAVAVGLVNTPQSSWDYSPMVPFPVLVFPPSDYHNLVSGQEHINAGQMDLSVRVVSLGKFHKAINVTVSVAITAACLTPGTLIHTLCPNIPQSGPLRIGHPSGTVQTRGEASMVDGQIKIENVSMSRTARRIMQGEILVPSGKLRWLASL